MSPSPGECHAFRYSDRAYTEREVRRWACAWQRFTALRGAHNLDTFTRLCGTCLRRTCVTGYRARPQNGQGTVRIVAAADIGRRRCFVALRGHLIFLKSTAERGAQDEKETSRGVSRLLKPDRRQEVALCNVVFSRQRRELHCRVSDVTGTQLGRGAVRKRIDAAITRVTGLAAGSRAALRSPSSHVSSDEGTHPHSRKRPRGAGGLVGET